MNLDRFEEAGKPITEKISDQDIKILFEIFKASDSDIIDRVIGHRYGEVEIAENEIPTILRVITSCYLGYYTAKFMDTESSNIRDSLAEAQKRLDNVVKFLEKKEGIKNAIK